MRRFIFFTYILPIIMMAAGAQNASGQYDYFSDRSTGNDMLYKEPFANDTNNKVQLVYSADDLSYYGGLFSIDALYLHLFAGNIFSAKSFTISIGQIPRSEWTGSKVFYDKTETVFGPEDIDVNTVTSGSIYRRFLLNKPFVYDPFKLLVIVFQQQGAKPKTVNIFGRQSGAIRGRRLTGNSANRMASYSDNTMYDIGIEGSILQQNDLMTGPLTSPVNFCGSKDTKEITVTVYNMGRNPVSYFDIQYSFDGKLHPPSRMFMPMQPGKSVSIVLMSAVFEAWVPHHLKVWTMNPNGQKDSCWRNDTLDLKRLMPDTIPPDINILGSTPAEIKYIQGTAGAVYHDPGAWAYDNIDRYTQTTASGTLLQNFPGYDSINKRGTYTIIYSASDKCMNRAAAVRLVHVSEGTPPIITLKGPQTQTICEWAEYKDPGYTVTDNADPPEAIKTDTFGSILNRGTAKPGQYFIRYKATDRDGNASFSDIRYINVNAMNTAGCDSVISSKLQKDMFDVYPNPVSETLTVHCHKTLPAGVIFTLTDVYGRNILSPYTADQYFCTYSADLSHLSAGIYLLKVSLENEQLVYKLIVEKK